MGAAEAHARRRHEEPVSSATPFFVCNYAQNYSAPQNKGRNYVQNRGPPENKGRNYARKNLGATQRCNQWGPHRPGTGSLETWLRAHPPPTYPQRRAAHTRTGSTSADTATGSHHLKTPEKTPNHKTSPKTNNRDGDDHIPSPPHAHTERHRGETPKNAYIK